MRLEGKTAIVAGAAWGGIGAASAIRLAEEGAHVVVTTRSRAAELDRTAEAIRDRGREAITIIGDVADEAHWTQARDAALDHWQRIDILLHNAGGGRTKPVTEFTDEDWEVVIGTNVRGAWTGAKTVIPQMRQQGGGSIVFISSVNSFVTGGGFGLYSTAKAGLNAMARSIALEEGRHGIRCNAIAPAHIAGERQRKRLAENPEDERAHRDCYPLGRYGAPEEIANVALFLASDESSFITGACIVADGGFTLATPEAYVVPSYRRRWKDTILVPVPADDPKD